MSVVETPRQSAADVLHDRCVHAGPVAGSSQRSGCSPLRQYFSITAGLLLAGMLVGFSKDLYARRRLTSTGG